jgi:Uma2 family endonuclease
MTPTMPNAVPAAPATPPPTASAVPPAAPPVMIEAERGQVRIPPGITDLAAFRAWLHSDDFPEKLHVCYLDGLLWVDLSMEQLYTHNQVKFSVALVLGALAQSTGSGRYVPDGMHLSHAGANLSTVPDGIFVSYAAFQSGRVLETPNARQVGAIDLAGTPDMVLEVVSDSSVQKDMVILPGLYQAAQIPEYWRIDARGDLRFEILRLTPAGYAPTQLDDGWWRSDVFGHDFRLAQATDPRGRPDFVLGMR